MGRLDRFDHLFSSARCKVWTECWACGGRRRGGESWLTAAIPIGNPYCSCRGGGGEAEVMPVGTGGVRQRHCGPSRRVSEPSHACVPYMLSTHAFHTWPSGQTPDRGGPSRNQRDGTAGRPDRVGPSLWVPARTGTYRDGGLYVRAMKVAAPACRSTPC